MIRGWIRSDGCIRGVDNGRGYECIIGIRKQSSIEL